MNVPLGPGAQPGAAASCVGISGVWVWLVMPPSAAMPRNMMRQPAPPPDERLVQRLAIQMGPNMLPLFWGGCAILAY